ncbi:MAG: hypothetical protein ACKVHR_12105 [Pirellulales bacterium]
MTSSKKISDGNAGNTQNSKQAKVAQSVFKPASAWIAIPRRGLFYLSSVLFLGWLFFLAVIAYRVNFQ